MGKFLISGGGKLKGSIKVGGAKNAVLPMLAATALTDEECVLENVPDILDVRNFLQILSKAGARTEFSEHAVKVRCKELNSPRPDEKLSSSMRGSVVLMGAFLGRLGKIELAYPGGDLIGARPIDVHLRAFRKMNVQIEEGPVIVAQTSALRGEEVFAESSVTGTENIILAAVLAEGTTVVKLAAQEPHVVALCDLLVSMGAKIAGIGGHTLKINGVKKLHGARARVIPDMLEAGSFAILGAATKSEITVSGVDHGQMDAIYNKLQEIGVNFDKNGSNLIINKPPGPYRAAVIRTGLYPNLATDIQPPFGVLSTQCTGKTIIHDWIFEGRLGYLKELAKMGAKVNLMDSHRAEVFGPTPLHGGRIDSLDIRSGMTLLIAALVAEGNTELEGVHHIDRGYENIEARLQALGAEIERVG